MRKIEIKFIYKKDSKLMRFIGWFLTKTGITRGFMKYFWTTIGNTIYLPDCVENVEDPHWSIVVRHETEHVMQFRKYGIFLMGLAYITLPVLFSGRWFIERYPYLNDLKAYLNDTNDPKTNSKLVNAAANTLWVNYFFPWPKCLMKKWFTKKLKEEGYLFDNLEE